jgi:hypothetical protein
MDGVLHSQTPDQLSELAQLRDQWMTESEAGQIQLIPQFVACGLPGLEVLMSWLLDNRASGAIAPLGAVYQALAQSDVPKVKSFLQQHFPQGLVLLQSSLGIDYALLQQLLIQRQFQEADRLTLVKLCELAGPATAKREWLYFTEVEQFPSTDLKTIDTLWRAYSQGKFGFSVQREIWLGVGQNWERLWPKIGWKTSNTWTRYPQGFIWDLTAPRGHLPLSNQLRGVRVIASLFSHPAWTTP